MNTQLDNLQLFPLLQTPNVASQPAREQGNNPAMANNQEQNTQPNPPINPTTSWSSLFEGGKDSPTDTALQRFELDMIDGVTQVPFDLRWKGLNVWRDYVVGFFLEQRLSYPVVKEVVKKKWKTKGDYEMVADTELFYFKFSNEEDKRKVLENSPIYIAGKCFIVTQWTQDIEKRKSTVKAIPIWVNMYNVPKDLWTGEGLGFLAREVNIGHTDASVIPRRAEAVNAEGVDRTEGNSNEVSMSDLCLSSTAVESEGILRRTDDTSVVAENAEGIVATEESTPLVEGSEVGLNETNMVLDRIEGSKLALVIATIEVTEVATGNAHDYDS
ncbi:hypothetical protein IFM89_008989 [Coptis chinensis]|uniref:DUF4283 domain-containing protein n=1 Tax=Coptis chinensis TaxID=261450 RepID=A0A835LQS7_9MAGN|nr:hypothetical protein IFM89_008989 [Coptis chinensis]